MSKYIISIIFLLFISFQSHSNTKYESYVGYFANITQDKFFIPKEINVSIYKRPGFYKNTPEDIVIVSNDKFQILDVTEIRYENGFSINPFYQVKNKNNEVFWVYGGDMIVSAKKSENIIDPWYKMIWTTRWKIFDRRWMKKLQIYVNSYIQFECFGGIIADDRYIKSSKSLLESNWFKINSTSANFKWSLQSGMFTFNDSKLQVNEDFIPIKRTIDIVDEEFWYYLKNNQIDKIKEMITNGYDKYTKLIPEVRTESPIFVSLKNKQYDLALFLKQNNFIQYYHDYNLRKSSYYRSIYFEEAIVNTEIDTLSFLLKNDFDRIIPGYKTGTNKKAIPIQPMGLAFRSNNIEIVKLMANYYDDFHIDDIKVISESSKEIIFYAIKNNIISKEISYNFNNKSNSYVDILFLMLMDDNLNLAKLLIENGVYTNNKIFYIGDRTYSTPIGTILEIFPEYKNDLIKYGYTPPVYSDFGDYQEVILDEDYVIMNSDKYEYEQIIDILKKGSKVKVIYNKNISSTQDSYTEHYNRTDESNKKFVISENGTLGWLAQ